jgi:hypothetical protein
VLFAAVLSGIVAMHTLGHVALHGESATDAMTGAMTRPVTSPVAGPMTSAGADSEDHLADRGWTT